MKTELENRLKETVMALEQDVGKSESAALNAVRARALNEYRQPLFSAVQRKMWPAASMVAASVLILMVVLAPSPERQINNQLVVDVQGADNLELYEDLEFYYWLAEDDANLRG